MRLDTLRKRAVVDPATGSRLGIVTDYWVDASAGRVAALTIRPVDADLSERVAADRVACVGRDAVMLSRSDGPGAGTPATPVRSEWLDRRHIRGMVVYTDTGERLGRINGAEVDQRTLAIQNYDLAPPLWRRWLAGRQHIAAASVAGGYLGPWMHYWWTRRGNPRSDEWYPATSVEGLKWWNPIDVAQHVDKIRAPILFNISDQEIGADTTLLRHLEDARKPFDAYVFPGEYHEKWQPAHRQAVYQRNLDWFRFWLQDYEDPDPAKTEQYERWRELRKLQQTQDAERARAGKDPATVH